MASPSAKTLTCVLLISKLMLKLLLSSLLTPSALILLLLLLLMITGACLVKFPKLGLVIAIVKQIVVQIFLPRKGLLKMETFLFMLILLWNCLSLWTRIAQECIITGFVLILCCPFSFSVNEFQFKKKKKEKKKKRKRGWTVFVIHPQSLKKIKQKTFCETWNKILKESQADLMTVNIPMDCTIAYQCVREHTQKKWNEEKLLKW